MTEVQRRTLEPALAAEDTGLPPRKRRRFRGGGTSGSGRDAWVLVLPALLPVVLFSVYPLAQGILLGFTDSRAGLNAETTFNGVDNYIELLGYDLFWPRSGSA